MPNGEDLDLNFVYRCTDPLNQGLRQTMLNQELSLMTQVDERHPLYRIQLDTMKDSAWKRFDDYNSHKGGLQFIPENKRCSAQCSAADFAQSRSFGFQHEPRRYSAFMQKPVDLQLSADEFISHYVDDCSEKEPPTVPLKNFMDPKNFSRGITVSDVDNINLSLDLSIGQSKAKDYIRSERNKSRASSSEVIDLEDPSFGLSKNNTSHELPPRFAAAKGVSKDKHKLESVSDVGPSCQRSIATYSGRIGHHREFPRADLFSKPKNLDLNMVQFEYSSCLSNNFSMVQNPSRTSFSGVTEKKGHRKHAMTSPSISWNKANVIDLCDSSDTHRQLDLNIDLTNNCGENNEGDKFRTGDSGGICVIDLDSDSGEPCSSNKSNPKIESVDSSTKFLNNLAQNQVPDERPNSPKLSSSSGSDHINDDRSNNLKTMQSVTKCEDLNFCGFDECCQKENLCSLTEPDQKSSDNTESNIQYVNNKKLEADEMVHKAAESLVKIYSETRVCHQPGLAKELPDKDNQPRCWSLDSYEKMVVWSKESEVDDFCVSSNAFVVDVSETKASRYKLKRGTRMKDFQKDVLPSLSTLSRHEINEDINIMEGVIRSREYRKSRAKIGDDGESFRAGRSKRSRAGYKRRYYE